MKRYSNMQESFKKTLKSEKGHDILVYLACACVAFVFWFFLSLDNEVQREIEVPFAVENIPDSVVMIGDIPNHLSVVVQARGSQLIPYMFGKVQPVKVKWAESNGDYYQVSRTRLESRLRDYFGQSVQILSIKPDSLRVPYTSSVGKRLPLRLNADIRTNLQCEIVGPVRLSVDSVTVFSKEALPGDIKYIETQPLTLSDLRDTTTVTVRVRPIAGTRIIPDRVKVRIPVEPLIAKRKKATIESVNVPENVGFLTFPSTVEVSYLVPMSRYNDDFPFKVYVDYNALNYNSNKTKVEVSEVPAVYRNVTLSIDSVEYVVEQ